MLAPRASCSTPRFCTVGRPSTHGAGVMGVSVPRSTSTSCYAFSKLVDVIRRGVAGIACPVFPVFFGQCEASLRLAPEDRLVLTQSSS
jgi:hypothetical protein